jgi:hypothetical protein
MVVMHLHKAKTGKPNSWCQLYVVLAAPYRSTSRHHTEASSSYKFHHIT